MKNNWKFILPMLAIGLLAWSCEKEEATESDNELIVDIMTTTSLEAIETTDLPSESQAYLDANYFDTYVEAAEQADAKGYRVELGTGEVIFFNTVGDVIEFDGVVSAFGRLGGVHPHGPCVRLLRRLRGHFGNHDTDGDGQPDGPFAYEVDSLASPITDYIAENYPDAEIRRAAFRDDQFLVLITGVQVLVFDADGNFTEERNPLAHCRTRCEELLRPDELPEGVGAYIRENFPDANFRRACQRERGVVVLLTRGEAMIVLGFNNEGELVFRRRRG